MALDEKAVSAMITSSTMRYQTVNSAAGQIGTTRTCITGTELKEVADPVSESHTRWRVEMRELPSHAHCTGEHGRFHGYEGGRPR